MFSSLRVFRDQPAAWAPTFYYFLVFGGFVAMFAYLPKLLTSVHDLDKPDAAARAAGFALVAVIARPIGGWLADRVGADTVLRVSFAATAVLAIAAWPRSTTQMVPLTVLALTHGRRVRARHRAPSSSWWRTTSRTRSGAVTGVVGAAGGLGGFFPPLVMAFVKSATGDYTLGFVLLAVTAVIALVVLQLMSRTANRAAQVAGVG